MYGSAERKQFTPAAYRSLARSTDLRSCRVRVKQTDLLVSAKKDLSLEARRLVLKYRAEIEGYILGRSDFLSSLVPVGRDPRAPAIVGSMIEASARAGVGPMAAVAGAIADAVGRDLLRLSSEVIVENGGDIFIRSETGRSILLLAETAEAGGINIAIPPSAEPAGVCTSSGTLGHSLSFGLADAVTVIGPSAAFADAAATAIANVVKSPADIGKGIRRAQEIGVHGVIIVVGEEIGAWGRVTFEERDYAA